MQNAKTNWIQSELAALSDVKEKFDAAHYRLEMHGPRTIVNITDRDHSTVIRALERYRMWLECAEKKNRDTGVFDENMRVVRQNDIVEYTNKSKTIHGKIVFECGAYGIGVTPGPIELDLLDSTHNDNFISLWELIYEQAEWGTPASVEGLRVIGNVFDNPELLSQEVC